MEIQDLRRQVLRRWIAEHHQGVVLRFAQSVRLSQPQIADTLRGAKSFGEKFAAKLEKAAGMPAGSLVNPTVGGVRESTQSYYGIQLTRDSALLAAEIDKLDVADQEEIALLIHSRVAEKVRNARKKRPRPPEDRKDA